MRITLLTMITACLCSLSPNSNASGQYSPLNYLPQGSRASVSIHTLDGKDDLSVNTDQMFPPASTLKVLTALAAKLELGDNFRFKTQAEQSGNDLIIRFSGDPTLTSSHLYTLLQQAKDKGIKTIKGNIWLDNSQFTGYDKAIGWPWDITGVCYSAPASAMNIDGNCIESSIYTKDNGQTRVYVPEQYPVYAFTNAITISKQQYDNMHCDLELTATPENHYQLSGCLVKRKEPLPLKFAVQNTELYTQRIVYKMLNQLGIELKGQVKIGKRDKGKLISLHQSEPLPKLLDTMLKRSDNLIADTLTKTIGQHFYQQPGSFSNGTEAIKQIIFAQTGVSLEEDQFVDGSGLSRNNRIRVSSMMSVLNYILSNDRKLGLIALLPSSGESGTLQYRRSMRDDAVRGKMKAKSGSVYGTYNMVGYGLNAQGKPNSIFIQFVTDYFPPKDKDKKPKERPIVTFEKAFYEQVIAKSQ